MNGLVIFHETIVKEENLDVNGYHLRNMAQIWPSRVDGALGRLAIDGNWRTTLMCLQLPSMLLDTKRVRVDQLS
jgi:hypothetical protein